MMMNHVSAALETVAFSPSDRRESASIPRLINDTIRSIMRSNGEEVFSLDDNAPIVSCGLDSLGLAILVARLEDELGVDPWTDDPSSDFPLTLGDFIQFYVRAVGH